MNDDRFHKTGPVIKVPVIACRPNKQLVVIELEAQVYRHNITDQRHLVLSESSVAVLLANRLTIAGNKPGVTKYIPYIEN